MQYVAKLSLSQIEAKLRHVRLSPNQWCASSWEMVASAVQLDSYVSLFGTKCPFRKVLCSGGRRKQKDRNCREHKG